MENEDLQNNFDSNDDFLNSALEDSNIIVEIPKENEL